MYIYIYGYVCTYKSIETCFCKLLSQHGNLLHLVAQCHSVDPVGGGVDFLVNFTYFSKLYRYIWVCKICSGLFT